ncbi:MAG TPA: tetratricopeptide repeat protein [Polyangiaceae bacterium]|jgi:tetratricopeptide (TPR) repeat protein|nr:tetratricopeptide repeat protein [Polyangiaceae bacterium]
MKRLAAVTSLIAIAVAAASPAHAGSEENIARAQNEVSAVTRDSQGVDAAIAKAKADVSSPESRVTNGELLFRMKDYDRALVVLSEVIEGFPETPSMVDAYYWRGETFYAAKDYLAARRDYRAIVKRGNEPRFQPYVAKALTRLVDVSFRTGDVASLDEVFANLNLVPPAQVDAALTYAKGKAYYAKKDYGNAQAQFQNVANGTPYTHQARYFQGLIVMKNAQAAAGVTPPPPVGTNVAPGAPPPPKVSYKAAIDAFKVVTDLPPDTDEHRHVIDLAWMAIGRMAYENEQFQLAREAYSKVGRDSKEFDTMLYELAWVYVRLGDVQRAERALEVLSIADPDSTYLADGTLLRADLLLRAGAFDKALELYTTVRTQYDPIRQKVEDFLGSTTDVAVFYNKLSQHLLDALDTSQELPAIAIRWAREMEDGPLAFAVIEDVNQCKHLIKQSEDLIARLNALIGASNRVRAFPELLAGEELALGLINRLSKARLEIAKGLDDEEPSSLSGDIGSVHDQRKKMEGDIAGLPSSGSDFAERDQQGKQQWNAVSQKLTQTTQEIDQLQAVVNGLRRMIKEGPAQGVTRDPDSIKRFNNEIDENERLLKQYQEAASILRRQIEVGRAQIGLGDARYQVDAQTRATYRDTLDREISLAQGGAAGRDAQAYSGKVVGILGQMRAQEDQLTQAFMRLESQVGSRIGELQKKVDAEAGNIASYKDQLGKLDGEAQDLVGHVAQRNFMLVRDKLKNIVLRADVGITEQAWEVREEELDRVRNLQTERSRQEQLLDEELKEVLDDSGDQNQTGAAGGGSK